ncbi:MAG: sugar phosphate isomerase/epimerase [Planctomycetota bacterium]
MSTQIAAQMYTLRDHCATPSDIAATCAKLKEMGFGAIQASAAGFATIEASELKTILDDTGMVCCATHFGLDKLENVEASVAYHETIGCGLTAIGGFGFGGSTEQDWVDFVQKYNALAKRYAETSLRLGYHNHSHEFSPFGLADEPAKIDPNKTPYAMLEKDGDAAVWMEVDTYWVAHGGGDPADWIKRFAGRVPAIHVKDMTVTAGREHKMCEVGLGNLNWPAILEAAKAAGTQWYIVERDSGDLDPFESLKISLENLKSWGLE